jgi:hypothetical protein
LTSDTETPEDAFMRALRGRMIDELGASLEPAETLDLMSRYRIGETAAPARVLPVRTEAFMSRIETDCGLAHISVASSVSCATPA